MRVVFRACERSVSGRFATHRSSLFCLKLTATAAATAADDNK